MNEVNTHPLDIATTLTEVKGVLKGETTPNYANMVGPFGGMLAATLLKAILDHPERLGEPVSITVNYAAPVEDGEFDVFVSIARTNRSTQHWTMDLVQKGEIVITGTAVCAKRRDTWSNTELPMPKVPKPAELERLATEGMPAWMHQYDMRFVSGIPNLATEVVEDSQDSTSILWIRDYPKRPLDYLSLVGICDAFLPRIFLREPQFVPASTVSLTVYFHTNSEMLANNGTDFVLGRARGHRFYDGFFDQFGEVWNKDGELIATTSQIVYFRD